MDLAEWLDVGRWLGLLDLIDMLPAACRLKEAIAQDDETAEYLLGLPEAEEPGEPWSPPVAEFNLTNSLLVTIVNELKSLRLSGQAMAGSKPKKEKPFPGPRTAIDRARERAEMDWFADMQTQFGFNK